VRHPPRPYQLLGIERVRDAQARGHTKICAVAPTGSGKTFLACALIEQEVLKGNPCLFVSHRKELTDQTSRALDDLGVDHGVMMADHWRRRPDLPVQVASIQTLMATRQCESCRGHEELKLTCNVCNGRGRRRARTLPPAKFIVVDEAHRVLGDMYTKLLENYPDAQILLLTATPWRLDGRGLGRMCTELVMFAEMHDLIAQGYLVPFRVFGPAHAINLHNVKISGGDYQIDQLSHEMRRDELVGDIVAHWLRLAEGTRTIVFPTSIDHSKDIVRRFIEAGVAAEHLDGSMKAEREPILARLASGATRIVCSVDVLCEGFDLPSIGCITLARPTLSITRYLQQVGRGSRICEGKTHCLVLDHANCTSIHGLPDKQREWTLRDRTKRSREPNDTQQCGKCGRFYAGEVCPSCQPRTLSLFAEMPEETNDELVELTAATMAADEASKDMYTLRSKSMQQLSMGLRDRREAASKPKLRGDMILCSQCGAPCMRRKRNKTIRVTCGKCMGKRGTERTR
jgi:DNA repair protein RadD